MNKRRKGTSISFLYKSITQTMSWFIFLSVLLAIFFTGERTSYAGYASIVVDAHSGKILYEKNADVKNYPASLTKMMTLYLLFEAIEEGRLTLNKKMHVSRRASRMSPTKLWLRQGQTISVRNAILGLVTESANDASVVIAETLGGSESNFAAMMTKKARQLGMNDTDFYNSSGLPHRKQLSTARDMAKLSFALLRDFPQYYHFFSTPKFRFRGRTYKNHNKLLLSCNGVDGIKTGYIRASKYNLAASAVRNNNRLIVVVFGCRTSYSRNKHVAQLMDEGFQKISQNSRLATLPVSDLLQPVASSERLFKKKGYQTARTDNRLKEESAYQKGKWGVQVGSFTKFSSAYETAENALQSAGDVLKDSKNAIDISVNDRGQIFYKSQLIGLMYKHEATFACHILVRKNHECFVVSH